MATYLGNYQSDSGFTFYRVPIEVYWVDSSSGSIRGNRDFSSPDNDRIYLPESYFQEMRLLRPREKYCEAPAKRFLVLWTTTNRYLHIDIPLIPGTYNFKELITQIVNQSKGKFSRLGLQGEPLDSRRLKLHVRTA